MKSAFSLIELIFVIVILGIVASFAIPKFVDTKDSATASTIRRDVDTAINSIQSYYLLNQKIDNISDAININTTNWSIDNLKISDKSGCLTLEITISSAGIKVIDLQNTTKNSSLCTKIKNAGVVTKIYELY